MKRKAAFAEEEDPVTGEAVLGTESSASIFLQPDEQSSERRKSWRRSGSDFASDAESTHVGTVLNVIKASKDRVPMLTVLAGDHEDNAEVWKECKNAGTKFRLFAFKDSVINGETQTYIVREILLSKEGGDLEGEDPNIILGQRKLASDGSIRLEAHHLVFRGRPDVNRPYIFPRLGDEIPGVGCPDLHCTFRAVRDYHTVEKMADFAGWDRNVTVEVSAEDVRSRKFITFDIERDELVSVDVKPTLGVVISCGDFEPLYNRLGDKEPYSTPPSKKGRFDERDDHEAKPLMTIGLKIVGMGPKIEQRAARADLNINLELKF